MDILCFIDYLFDSSLAETKRNPQKEHPQNPIVRESCETDEEKLLRALGMGMGMGTGGVVSTVAAREKTDQDKASVASESKSKSKAKSKALRGYSGFLALLYAFTEQPNSGEVRPPWFLFWFVLVCRFAS